MPDLLGHQHTVVFHHSGSARSKTVDDIRDWHTKPKPEGNGWPDIGYHYVIGPTGQRWDCRPLHLIGFHAVPNAGRIGVCLIGNNLDPRERWTEPQICSAYKLLLSLQAIFPGIEYAGHRDVVEPGHTECPGIDVRWLFSVVQKARDYDWRP